MGVIEFDYFEWSMHQAATRLDIAPLAPRDVAARSLRSRVCAVREVNEPKAPAAIYRARKFPRPISSCTGSVSVLFDHQIRMPDTHNVFQ